MTRRPAEPALQAALRPIAERPEKAPCRDRLSDGFRTLVRARSEFSAPNWAIRPFWHPSYLPQNGAVCRSWSPIPFSRSGWYSSHSGGATINTDLFDPAPLLAACVGRRSDYAVQLEDGRYARIAAPLTSSVLARHLAGGHTIGSYLLDRRDRCHAALLDADAAHQVIPLLDLHTSLATRGIASHLEGSRRGLHLWFFLDTWYPAAAVRAWLRPLVPEGVELYPKQDRLTPEVPYGSLVRLPLGIHRRSGRRYPFLRLHAGRLVPVARTLSGMLSYLEDAERVALPDGTRLTLGPPTSPAGTRQTYISNPPGGAPRVAPFSTIREWSAHQDPFTLIGRYVTLDARGMGSCPFGGHHDDGVDTHPSFSVYQPKQPGGYCWYCHTGRCGGSVFDFLCRYYGLEPREAWHRILSGAQF